MSYKVALLVAGLIIVAIALFSWWSHDAVERAVRAHLRVQKDEGQMPPEFKDADIDTLDLSNYKVKVPAGLHARQSWAMLLARTWFLWAPAIVGVCLGLAALLRHRRG